KKQVILDYCKILEIKSMEIKMTKGEWVSFENEKFYKIENSDAVRPFFMSIVSDSDHWMFISSN
ncbi:MAG TPA: hypothetical protein DCS19_09625, partial [Flavobacterium sp.]|nr:hypothetical protein [Flavobacterium sp.]